MTTTATTQHDTEVQAGLFSYPPDWYDRPVLVFDVETTGTDPLTDHIVTFAIAIVAPNGDALGGVTRVIKPVGFEVPADAAAIHGWTQERLMAYDGAMEPTAAWSVICRQFVFAHERHMPIVAYNAPFDLTMFERELWRSQMHAPRNTVFPILDPLVLDRTLDRYRKGSRKLTDVCAHYGVELGDDAHDAQADAIATGRLLFKMIEKHDKLQAMPLEHLHSWQQKSYAEDQARFEAYLRKKHPFEDVEPRNPHWPVIPPERTE